jgi:hypothetical protein
MMQNYYDATCWNFQTAASSISLPWKPLFSPELTVDSNHILARIDRAHIIKKSFDIVYEYIRQRCLTH